MQKIQIQFLFIYIIRQDIQWNISNEIRECGNVRLNGLFVSVFVFPKRIEMTIYRFIYILYYTYYITILYTNVNLKTPQRSQSLYRMII